MTVENTQNKMPPLQMGTATEYPFTFAVLLQDPTEEEALKAIKVNVLQADGTEIELVYGVDYTVNLNTDRIGGTVFVKDVRTSGDYLTIYREYTHTQEVDYQDLNAAPAETFEQCFDKLTMLSQQQQEAINRSLKLNISSTTVSPTLPEPIANNTLIWDSEGASLKNYDIIGENDAFKKQVNDTLASGQQGIQGQFDALEQAQEAAFEQFKTEVNNDIADVREAAEKVNALDESIKLCQDSAAIAIEKAEIAEEKTNEILEIKDELEAEIENKADIDLSNLSEIGQKKLSSGGGLELGFIGFTQGYIDETKNLQRCLNKTDNYIIQDQFAEFTYWLKKSAELNPNIVCTNEEYETALAMSINNTCDKYVIDDIAGTIRLPKYPEYFIGGVNSIAPVVGNGLSVGFKVGDAPFGLGKSKVDAGVGTLVGVATALYGKKEGTDLNGAINKIEYLQGLGLTNDPKSSGMEAQIKQDQIKGTYFIQVATGSSTSADFSNELQLNNPKVLLESKYFNPEIYNASWLIANGSFNGSNAIHPSVYQALLIEHNSDIAVGTTSENGYTKRGLSVKLSTDTDISEYDFVLNTTDETFRLPIFDGSEEATTTNFQDFALGDSGNSYIAPANGWFSLNITGKNARMYTSALSVGTSSGDTSDKNTQIYIKVSRGERVYVKYSSYTAVGAFKFVYAKGNGSLYYYVGNALQNTGIVNVGRIEEKVATLIPDNSNVICNYVMQSTKYVDYTLGASATEYIAPANGYFVVNLQGGGIRINTIPKDGGSGLMSGASDTLQATLPVEKGGKMIVRYANITVNTTFRFYYMKGEV